MLFDKISQAAKDNNEEWEKHAGGSESLPDVKPEHKGAVALRLPICDSPFAHFFKFS